MICNILFCVYLLKWSLCSVHLKIPVPDHHLRRGDMQYDFTIPYSMFSSTEDSMIELSVVSKPSWVFDDSTGFKRISHFYWKGYSPTSGVYRDNFLYTALDSSPRTGTGFTIFNVTDRHKPFLVGSVSYVDHSLYTIATFLDGNFAFTTTKRFLFIIDITNVCYPEIVGKTDIRTTNSFGLYVEGDFAYVAGDFGLFIFDVSSKSNPVFVSSVMSNSARFVYVRNNTALVHRNSVGGLSLYNVTDKSSPKLFKFVELTGEFDGEDFSHRPYYNCISEDGKYLYVSYRGVSEKSLFGIVDISDIENPVNISVLNTTDYKFQYASSLVEKDGYVYIGTAANERHGLIVIDVRNQTNPKIVGNVEDVGDFENLIISDDDFGFFLFRGSGVENLKVIDFSDKKNPKFIQGGDYSVMNNGAMKKIIVDGDFAFVTDQYSNNNDLKIFDISKPQSPVLIAIHPSHSVFVSNVPQYASVDGGEVLFVLDSKKLGQRLTVFDFSKKNFPVLKSQISFTEYQSKMVILGNHSLYFTTSPQYPSSDYYLSYIDISDRFHPNVIVSSAFDEKFSRYFVMEDDDNGKVYGYFFKIKKNDEGWVTSTMFYVLDISDLNNPIEIGSLDFYTEMDYFSNFMVNMEIQGSYVFIQKPILFVVDVSDRKNPRIISKTTVTDSAKSLFVQGDFALIVDDYDGVYVFDLSNVTEPIHTKTISECGGEASQVSARGNHAFITWEDIGLVTYEIGNLELVGTIPSYTSFCEKVDFTVKASDGSNQPAYLSYSLFFPDDGIHKGECGGHGSCSVDGVCVCEKAYFAAFENGPCTEWQCGSSRFYDKSVCGGHGECLSPGECHCDKGYSGRLCDTNQVNQVLQVVLPTFSVIVISILGLCCCCCVFCLLVLICFLSVIIPIVFLCRVVWSQRAGLTRYRKLKDFDILLKEQLLDDSGDVARFKIKKEVFKIPFNEVIVQEVIGEGGSQALVFKAVWQDRIVAFKCFKTRHLFNTENEFAEFEREVSVIASISHPGVIRFFGCTIKPPRVGIIMEYCENGEILDFFRSWKDDHSERTYPQTEKIRMINEIVAAMSYLHSRSIIHRDLKCGNILVDGNESTRVMDFGLARFVEKTGNRFLTSKVGTNVYMPPEIAVGNPYNEKCDVFSWAVTVYVILTEDDRPYGVNDFNVQYKVANNEDLRPSTEKMEEVIDEEYRWIIEIVKRSWKAFPAERPSFLEIQMQMEEEGEQND